MDFDSFLGRAWDDHASDAEAVAARLAADGPGLVTTEAQLVSLANLVHHVDGEHLGRWRDGREALNALSGHPAYRADGPSGAALRRYDASLALSAGEADPRPAMPLPERIRVTALAAASLAERDTPRASVLFVDALGAADDAGLADDDPVHRALAVTANNLACTLEEKTGRSADERELMIAAATAARRHWALAGTWLETERAEYRLAMTWLQAGDAARAVEHARSCLAIVADNGGCALERFFGNEALALACSAAGDADTAALATTRARDAFDALDESDRSWCRDTLDKLERTAQPTRH